MNVTEIIKHPIVSNLVVTFVATILAYKLIQYWESKATESTGTTKMSKQSTKIPAPQTTTTVVSEQMQEVTGL